MSSEKQKTKKHNTTIKPGKPLDPAISLLGIYHEDLSPTTSKSNRLIIKIIHWGIIYYSKIHDNKLNTYLRILNMP